MALIDLLDRLLAGGVVVTGDVVLSIADIDLVRISLRALIASISERTLSPWATAPPAPAAHPDGHDLPVSERHAPRRPPPG
ncbi:gas vesicle protein GvpJ [Streptomyces gilvosporeus]|nr:gas vesicle protein GvpJ [Streptomyces gilvosporeus]